MGEKPIPLDTNAPPNCPACHKRVFRPGHMVTMMENRKNRDNAESFTVCMHCSAIWRLHWQGKTLKLVPLTKAERDDMWPALSAAVAKFNMNRRVAERWGMTIEEFMDRIDALPAHIRAKLMD